MSTEDYIKLITQEHRPRPRYEATVRASVAPLAHVQDVLRSLVREFDVDDAKGLQLDTVGRWVGISRTVDVPINDIYFAWDDTPETGWDRGVWEGIGDDKVRKYQLPDESYRRVIYAKIKLNSWKGFKGTIEDAYAIYDTALPSPGNVRIIDGGLSTRPLKVFTWDKIEHGWEEAAWAGGYEIIMPPASKLFTWRRNQYGWMQAYWAGKDSTAGEKAKIFKWDTDAEHGWDAGWWDGDWSSTGGGGIIENSDMNVWVLVREGAFPMIDETLVTSGYIPFKLAGVNVTYGTF